MRLSELIKKRRLTRFSSVIPLLLPIYMDAHVWNDDDYVAEVYERKRKYIIDKILLLYTKNNNIDCTPRYKWTLDDKGDPRINGETGEPIQELDLQESDVDLVELIRCMVNDHKDRLTFPDELLIAAGIQPPNATGIQKRIEVDSETEGADDKYPVYKDLKFVGLPKNKFDDLKRHYGMLRDEESKWRRAIAIAAKIGILFYERNLDKPTNRDAFLAEYKAEFDTILKNDTVAKHIYSSLPEHYRGGKGGRENTVDIVPIIKAAVYAGSIYDTDDVKYLETLKSDLAGHQYRVPPDEILMKIIEATKDI